jgi:hypothetical protein
LNKQERTRKLLKLSNPWILGAMTALYLTISFFLIISLLGKSYVLTKSDLFPIDSVRMLSRAYIIGGGKTSSKSIQFDDETYRTFSITGPRYLAITDFSTLYDTLQYSGVVMKVYTNKQGHSNYFDKNSKDKIEVYGIEVGNKSYISLDDISKKEKVRTTSILSFCTIAYCIFFLIHFLRVSRTNKSIQHGFANTPADE